MLRYSKTRASKGGRAAQIRKAASDGERIALTALSSADVGLAAKRSRALAGDGEEDMDDLEERELEEVKPSSSRS